MEVELQIIFYITILFSTSHILFKHYLGRLTFALIILPPMLGLLVRNQLFRPNFELIEQFVIASFFLVAGYQLMRLIDFFAPKKKYHNAAKKEIVKHKLILWIIVLFMFIKVVNAVQEHGISEVKVALTRNNGFIFLFQMACLKLLIADQIYRHKTAVVLIIGFMISASGSRFQALLFFATKVFWGIRRNNALFSKLFYMLLILLFLIIFTKIRDGGDLGYILYWLLMRFDFFFNSLKLTSNHINSSNFFTYPEHLMRVVGISLPNDIGLLNRYFHSLFTELGSKSSGYAFGEYLVFDNRILPFFVGCIAFSFHKFLIKVFLREDITSIFYFLLFVNVVNFHYEGLTGPIFQTLVLNSIYSVVLIRFFVR